MRRDGALWIALTTVATAMSGPVLTQGQSGQVSTTATGIIAGRVVDAVTGEPVADATVRLSSRIPGSGVLSGRSNCSGGRPPS